jgi:phosphomannomutase
MNKTIFKAYDIRGIYPTDINESVAMVVAKAAAMMFPAGEIIVAYDARHGSTELALQVQATLEAESELSHTKKHSVRNVGMASTPMFYFLVNHFKAVGGVMITASHNPKNYNGMKIVKAGAEMVPGVDVLEFITQHNLS